MTHTIATIASPLPSIVRFRRAALALLAATLLAAALLVPVGFDAPAASAQGYCASAEEVDMLGRINELRRSRGLAPLTLSVPLGAAADIKSADMANNNYFAHVSPGGVGPRDVLNRVGYPGNASYGENIAAGNASASGTYQQWLNSPPHREAMLNPNFTAIGIARADNPNARYDHYWTSMFGNQVVQQASACSGANPNPPPPPPATRPPTGGNDTVGSILAVLIAILSEVLS